MRDNPEAASENPNTPQTSQAVQKGMTLRQLAAAIGVDAGQLSKESKRPGFPPPVDGLYDADLVRAWRHRNVRKRKDTEQSHTPASAPPAAPPTQSPAAAPVTAARPARPAPTVTSPPPGADGDLMEILRSPDATALQITRATAQLAARQCARQHESGWLAHNDLDSMKKTLQELRNAEADYVALEKARGQLIERTVVYQIVGECCARLVQCTGNLANKLAAEISLWIADPAIVAMNADDRARHVRQFVTQCTEQVRSAEAAAVDQMIAEAEQ